MSGPVAGESHRFFAIACGVWIIASLVVPALSLWDTAILLLLFLTGGWWLPIVVLWTAIPAMAAFRATKSILKRRYVSALGWLTVPAAGVGLVLLGTDIGDAVRFRINKAAYDRVVAEAEASKCAKDMEARKAVDGIDCDPLTAIFAWGGFGPIWHGIVYDAGDEIIKPPQDRSAAWKNRPIGSLLSCSGGKRAFGDHYYRAGGSYTGGDNDCG